MIVFQETIRVHAGKMMNKKRKFRRCHTFERELIARIPHRGVEKSRKKKVRLIILLGIIWFVITLPLPWIIGNPDVEESSLYTILGIVGVMSVPFVVLGIVWTLKPELTT